MPTTHETSADRRRLIKELWPDKRLYACIMLFVAGLAGMLYSLLVWNFPVQFGGRIPRYLIYDWQSATFLLSAGTVAAAWVALKARRNAWAYVGVGQGVGSMGLLGLVPLFSLLALGFLIASKLEGEDDSPHTEDLHVHHWPDKSLAASLLILVGAIIALAWGGALLTDRFTVQSGDVTMGLGVLALAAGLVGLPAAWLVYHQRGRALAIAAAILQLVCFAFFAVGPILAVATLVLIRMASSEREFEDAAAAA